MKVPPAFKPRVLRNPAMAETKPGSVFTPAISAWSSPGALGDLDGLALPTWLPYALLGVLGLLAWRGKIPWWAGLAGAGAVWYFLLNTGSVSAEITTGQGIVASGSTIHFSVNSPGTLTGSGTSATMTVGGTTYPVLQTEASSDGTTTYYLDNPTTA